MNLRIQETPPKICEEERGLFRRWLEILNGLQVRYVLGGAFAFYLQTGILRDTKDLDVFLQARDLKKVLAAFAAEGFETELRSPHWLAKVCQEPYLLDLLFGFWNGRLRVTEEWLAQSRPVSFIGLTVPLMSLENLIYSKVFVAARDRFDGSDVLHLIRSAQGSVAWPRVLDQMGDDYPLLLWYLILFEYVYPEGDKGVRETAAKLFRRLKADWGHAARSEFRGPLLDPLSYIPDLEEGRYADPRDMTPLVDEEGNLL